jgi:DNA-binding response OmpR family regulator
VGEILLIAADWRLRALVRAQLLEEGFEVRALPALEVALAHLTGGGARPGLILLDTQGAAFDAQAVSALRQVSGQAPLILCGGAWSQVEAWQEGLTAARVLRRPFRVGDLVEEVRRNWGWVKDDVSPA